MANARPGLERRYSGRARVGKEVQNAYVPAGRAYLAHDVVPVGSLLGENARVLEVHGLYVEFELSVAYLPACGQGVLVPNPAAGVAALVAPVTGVPTPVAPRSFPDSLRVRPHKGILPPTLELLAVRAVYELIILPVFANPHTISSNVLYLQIIT